MGGPGARPGDLEARDSPDGRHLLIIAYQEPYQAFLAFNASGWPGCNSVGALAHGFSTALKRSIKRCPDPVPYEWLFIDT